MLGTTCNLTRESTLTGNIVSQVCLGRLKTVTLRQLTLRTTIVKEEDVTKLRERVHQNLPTS